MNSDTPTRATIVANSTANSASNSTIKAASRKAARLNHNDYKRNEDAQGGRAKDTAASIGTCGDQIDSAPCVATDATTEKRQHRYGHPSLQKQQRHRRRRQSQSAPKQVAGVAAAAAAENNSEGVSCLQQEELGQRPQWSRQKQQKAEGAGEATSANEFAHRIATAAGTTTAGAAEAAVKVASERVVEGGSGDCYEVVGNSLTRKNSKTALEQEVSPHSKQQDEQQAAFTRLARRQSPQLGAGRERCAVASEEDPPERQALQHQPVVACKWAARHTARESVQGVGYDWDPCGGEQEVEHLDTEAAPFDEQLGGHSSSSFWRLLSNLTRSITQRSEATAALVATETAPVFPANGRRHLVSGPCGSDGVAAATDTDNSTLAPEVVGYLESRRRKQQRRRERRPCFVGCEEDFEPFAGRERKSDFERESMAKIATGGRRGQFSRETGGEQQLMAETSQQQSRVAAIANVEASRELGTGQELQQLGCNSATTNHYQKEGASQRFIKIVALPMATSQTQEDDHQHPYQVSNQEEKSNRTRAAAPQQEIHDKLTHHINLSNMAVATANTASNTAPAKSQTNKQATTFSSSSSTPSSSSSSSSSASSGPGLREGEAEREGVGGVGGSLSSCVLSDSNSTSSEVRLKWGKKMDFLLSIIGFAVDLANIWRFPYLVYKNGGGVFLIPYVTMLIFGGIPLFFLELCLGQYVKKGPITVWNKICPTMKGVGYCSILISWYVSFYYNVLIAWSVYFIYRSFSSIGSKMPWEDCDNLWNNRDGCLSIASLKFQCSTRNASLEQCRRDLYANKTTIITSPASEFFVKELSQIDQSSGLEDMGYLRPELVMCTIIVYLLHYFSLFRGLETSGKVVWVTATAPYMILSILLMRGLFLPGASMGIEYYLSPKLEKLAEPQVWIDAAGQVFYSIGVGFGVHLTYASFNSHNNNCYRDCLMTSAVNAATSVYSGLVVFVYLGYMATNLGIEIDKVASEGYSLVFEVYPEALTTLPFARFWSILFFIMLLTLGIDSAMGGLEAVITGLEDEFKFAKRLSRAQLTGLVIVSSFVPALISCTQGGAYTLFWFDIYSAGVSLLFSALFETIGVVYCYGLDKFILNIESMLGRKPQLFYILCWKYISPLFLGVVIFMSLYTASQPVYRGYTFPLWSIVLGWCLAFSSVAAVPIVAILTWYSKKTGKIRMLGSTPLSPEKTPRKRVASGTDSAVSRSRHITTTTTSARKSLQTASTTAPATPAQVQADYKSVSVSCGDQLTTSSTITTHQLARTTKIGEHML